MTINEGKLATISKRASRLILKRPKGWKSLMYNTAMAKSRISGPLMMPVHVSIEPTNACNAACPVCETGKNEMLRPKGLLDIDKYKRFIDDIAPTTVSLMFYYMGEPFLHKKSYEMIRYARDKGLYVETCTNGDMVNPEKVLDCDINLISFQIGGMDKDTHGRYRVNSDFNKVQANLLELIEQRNKRPGSNVKIEVGFIVMRHNEHQVDEFTKWAQDIGVDKYNVIDPCVRSMMEAYAYLTKDKKYWFYDEEAFEEGVLKPKHIPNNECTWIWNSVQINWNGDVVPCCRDVNGRHVLGNVFKDGLRKVWNGPKATKFRKNITSRQNKIKICDLCSGYGVPHIDKE